MLSLNNTLKTRMRWIYSVVVLTQTNINSWNYINNNVERVQVNC